MESERVGPTSVVARKLVTAIALCVVLAGAQSSWAQVAASSVFYGTVKDDTGLPLPGVTVTLTSPELQVGRRVTVSSGEGEYRFGELPGGTYELKFELAGFHTMIRDNMRLTINFMARVDVTMGVGQVEESVTVSGEAPVVDVATTGTAANFTTEVLEAVPRGRDIWMVVDMAPGVARPGAPDVGGSGMTGRRAMVAYGDPSPQPKLDIEGINIVSGGAAQSSVYFNDFGFEEVQFTTSGANVEMGTPGIHMMAVLKSGGNAFHGSYLGSYEGPKLQSSNLTPTLQAQGLNDTTPLSYAYDLAGDLGGRIIRDRLWFYGGYNTQNRKTTLLGFVSGPGPDGKYLTGDEPLADYDNTLRGGNIKGSWQISKNNRLIGVYMRANKLQPQESAGRFRPLEATRDYVNLSEVKKVELQSTLGPRMLLDFLGGYGGFWGDYNAMRSKWYPGTPSVLHRETGLRTGSMEASDQRPRYNYQTDGSVTFFPERTFVGHHEIKAGEMTTYYVHGTGLLEQPHGNYVLVYDGPTPAEIQILNNPVTPRNRMNFYVLYGKDSWRVKDNLTLNFGLRYERQTSFVPAQKREASLQFPTLFPAGDFPKTDLLTWNQFLPRVGAAWSVDGKTAIKFTAGGYSYLWSEDSAGLYNLNAARTATFRWTDPDRNGNYTPGEVNLDLNGPAFINISSATNRRFNADLVHPLTTEMTASIEREVAASLGVRAGYVFRHRENYFSTTGVNELRPYSVYNIPLTRRDPGPDAILGNADDGGTVTIYDYDPAYRGAAFVRNTMINSPKTDTIQTIEFAVTKRPTARWAAQGSFWMVKNNRWIEQTFETPNNDYFPKDETWDWASNLSGTYTLPGDIRVAGFLQTKAGAKGQRTYIFGAMNPSGGPPLRQLTTVTLRLEPYGSQQLPAVTSLNLRGSKTFNVGGSRQVGLDVDVFNVLNGAAPSAAGYQSGPAFGYATEVLSGRIARLGAKFSF